MRIRHSHLLAAAALFASAGNSAVHIAIPWLVLEITGSSANAGVVLGISGFSVIFTAPIIGGLIAVLGARPVSIWADIISAGSVVLFPIVGTLFGLNLASLLIIAIVGALFDPAGATARKSLIQAVAERDGLSLLKFNGTYEAAATIGTVIGPTGAALAIGFVGIIVPHLVRLVVGADHRLVLPASFFFGAAFLVACDVISRIVMAPLELPVGIITALVGGPFFLWMLIRKKT